MQLDQELGDVLARLGTSKRQKVLEYARSLQKDEDTPVSSLLEFVGSISTEDLQLMRDAIEEDSERVRDLAGAGS